MTQQTVELIDHMGDDLRVVNAARVSFDKESAWEFVPMDDKGWFPEPVLAYSDDRLLRYLAKHKHFTPFTHNQITLRETVPIFVARQRFKHVVGFSYNEVSRRYVSDTPDFFLPQAWRKAAESVKQGSSEETIEFVWYEDGEMPEPVAMETENIPMVPTYSKWSIANAVKSHYRDCLELYEELLGGGVCPEQARMVLPQAMMTSYYVTGSLAAFARAYGLRKDPHAQAEIRDLANHWDRLIRPLFPQSWSALVD